MTKSRPLIAIVDGDETIRKAFSRLLRSAGLDVETFPSGLEFLESIATQRPDCVVLDVRMPYMHGLEVQARLAKTTPSIPAVIVTGDTSTEMRDLALAGLPAAYLRKPVDDHTLLDAIDLALARGQQERSKT